MIKCYLVDDETHIIELLSSYIHKTPGLELIGFAENPLIALDDITNGKLKPQITFVDVDMPELSGIELADLITPYTEVIFATAYSHYAVNAFEKDAVDFLLKPVSYGRFLKAVDRAKSRINHKINTDITTLLPSHFFVKSDIKGKMVKIEHHEITYIESLQNYVRIHVLGDSYVTHLSLKKVEEHLPKEKFSRVHKSFLINNDMVRVVEGGQVTLIDKSTIAIGHSYRESFLKKITKELLFNKSHPVD